MTRDRVLVTGVTGFVGRRVVERFAADGRNLRVATRRIPDSLPASVEAFVISDLGGNTSWQPLLSDVDLVVHCAAHIPLGSETATDAEARCRAVNHDATVSLARAAADAGVRRFLFISSIKVHGESTPPDQGFDENSPLAPEDAYGRSKRDAELALQRLAEETGLDVVIIRPPLVYGPQAKGNVATLLNFVRRGLPLPLGAVHDNRRAFLGLDNLVQFLEKCVDAPAAANQAFVLADNEQISTADFLHRIGRAVGRPARLVSVPPALLAQAAKLLGRRHIADRVLGSLRVNDDRARSLLGWSPPFTMDDGLHQMALHS